MKVAFFGGAFDPFHNEHRKIIIGIKEQFGLDTIVIYPSFLPPHKTCVSDFSDRFNMTKIATSDLPYVVVDDLEKHRNTINPTSEILPVLKSKYPADKYYLVIGGDSMLNFHKWIKPEKIAKECEIIVFPRGDTNGLNEAITKAQINYGADITLSSIVCSEISSSTIRAMIELNERPDCISNSVYNYIKEQKMYSEFEPIVEKMRNTIPTRTFDHVKRTVKYAFKLNTKLGLDYKKVFLSTFLHDCAKHLHRAMEGVPLAVEHQFLGVEIAQKDYDIHDKDVLDAINYHTTGRPNMSTLEKLVFCADMLEEGRNYVGVDELRNIIENDFEKGFVACVNGSLNKLIEDNRPFHPLTKACALYYNSK